MCNTHTCMHTCKQLTHIHIYTHTCKQHTYTCTHTHIRTHTHKQTNKHIHTHMHNTCATHIKKAKPSLLPRDACAPHKHSESMQTNSPGDCNGTPQEDCPFHL